MTRYIEIQAPEVGSGGKYEIIGIPVRPGDRIDADTTLLTIESDKTVLEIPSPQAGVVRQLLLSVGDTLSSGSPILVLEPDIPSAQANPAGFDTSPAAGSAGPCPA